MWLVASALITLMNSKTIGKFTYVLDFVEEQIEL